MTRRARHAALSGFHIIGVIEAKLITKKRLDLMKGFVEPCFRKQGIMKRMEERLVWVAKARGIKEIELGVVMPLQLLGAVCEGLLFKRLYVKKKTPLPYGLSKDSL